MRKGDLILGVFFEGCKLEGSLGLRYFGGPLGGLRPP